ncbi:MULTISPECIES: hypothetical protein [unclassified Frigoribacterium]|jgi:hypothetical protein|uniref:hypothetical protein n=1 Tax=unclassified Frigoribacterium TaxID=2627005 RepID=UPI0005B93925|nr:MULTISPECIES: hypothetical protein [unclassified Frigoribacterium]KIU03482.1 hypothetical protein SZ60_05435 [Frigoribacterium sp. MEB024]KQN45459.1 hypothetical protein ASE87_02375 [Frigoribacterium sp. Leaf44]PZO56280.1 MAG: hypothetical protein DI639_17535 [Leifsonia xyli]
MIVLLCTGSLPGVGSGYVCVVAPRMLKHVLTESTVTALRSIGQPPRAVSAAAFLDILTSLSIPHSAVTSGADYSAR